jgi:hypothetical protein
LICDCARIPAGNKWYDSATGSRATIAIDTASRNFGDLRQERFALFRMNVRDALCLPIAAQQIP